MRQKNLKQIEKKEILDILLHTYAHARAELDHRNPFELLIATILSAQCTDIRVNLVTKDLFNVLPAPEAITSINHTDLEKMIKPCGLYQTKAKNIRATCEILVAQYEGQVPASIEQLTLLPGVGIKTANVVASNAFGIPAIAVDTHVHRVSNRLGLVHSTNVGQTEKELQQCIPKAQWTKMHHVLIFHGRYCCKARNPQCYSCPVSHLCLTLKAGIPVSNTRVKSQGSTKPLKGSRAKRKVNIKQDPTKA